MIRRVSPDRVYGPHRVEDEPRHVTVFRSERDGGDYQAPIPRELLEVRRQLNERAAAGEFAGLLGLPEAEVERAFTDPDGATVHVLRAVGSVA